MEEVLSKAVLLSVLGNRLVDGLITPVFDRFKWDKFWLKYVAWALCGLFAGLGEVNLLAGVLPEVIWGAMSGRVVGIVLTAVIAGGGANLIHDVFDRGQKEAPAN